MKRIFSNLLLQCTLVSLIIISIAIDIFAQSLKTEIEDALNAGDTTKAIELLNNEINIDASYYYNYYILGQIYYDQFNYQKALNYFLTAVGKKKKHFESQYLLGMCYLALGDIDEAEKIFIDGRKKAKENKHSFNNGYGLVLMEKEQYQEADRMFREALIKEDLFDDRTKAEYHINLGDANFYQGIPSLAISEYKKALEVDTASKEVYYHWAEACLEMKDYGCAIEKLGIVLKKDSTHAQAWNRAGGIYFKAALSSTSRDDRKSRFMDAIGSYKKFIQLSGIKPDSQNVRVYFELAMSYVNINGFEDAVENFDKVLGIPYEARDIYFYYGKALWGNKDYDRAAEMFLKHLDWVSKQDKEYVNRIDNSELYRYLGDCYYFNKENKDFSKVTQYYKKSLEIDPNQPRLVQSMALAYHNLRSYNQALEYYQKRIDFGIDSSSASILKNAASCALSIANNSFEGDDLELEDIEDVGEVEGASTIDPNINYFEVALEYMKKYLDYNPQDSKMLLLIADTYLRQMADCSNGVLWYNKLLEIEPNNCDAQKAIGYAYFGGLCEKDFGKALKYLLQAENCLGGGCNDIDLTLWIAQCYHLRAVDKAGKKQDANEDFKNAFNWYGKVLKCNPSNVEAKKGQDNTRFEFYDDKG